MIKISKEESKYLQKQGFRFGSTLHKTVHGYNYYMSEYVTSQKELITDDDSLYDNYIKAKISGLIGVFPDITVKSYYKH